MKLIAHRGLTTGPNKQFENQPNQINSAIEQGFDCEVDLWVIGDRLYLGHDEPMYNITMDFIQRPQLWIHAKSLATLTWLTISPYALNYFWHQEDDYTITSQGHIWAYPGKMLNKKCVMVMPEWDDPKFEKIKDVDCLAICSDYVLKLKEIMTSGQSR
jgi:hypothetical protein